MFTTIAMTVHASNRDVRRIFAFFVNAFMAFQTAGIRRKRMSQCLLFCQSRRAIGTLLTEAGGNHLVSQKERTATCGKDQ
jgi:hypothetical protein